MLPGSPHATPRRARRSRRAPTPPRADRDAEPDGDPQRHTGRCHTTADPALDVMSMWRAKRLGRGVNFGNMLEAPTEGEWGITLEEVYFDLVKPGGFQHHTPAHALVGACAGQSALHDRSGVFCACRLGGGQRHPARAKHRGEHASLRRPDEEAARCINARFVALWRQIGARYADRPHSVLLEICNEPNGMSAKFWNGFLLDALAAVRREQPDAHRCHWRRRLEQHQGLLELKLPDARTKLARHVSLLSPFEFTHQGAEWVSGSATPGWARGGRA